MRSLFAWGWANQETGVGASVCKSQLPSGSGSTLSLSTKNWGLLSLVKAETHSHLILLGQVKQSKSELSSPRGVRPLGCLITMLFAQPSWITSYFEWIKFSSLPHPKLSICISIELAPSVDITHEETFYISLLHEYILIVPYSRIHKLFDKQMDTFYITNSQS